MKGLVLAGGHSARFKDKLLQPIKHHSYVINSSIKTLLDSGVKDLVVVLGGENPGKIIDCLESTYLQWRLHPGFKSISYVYQTYDQYGIGAAIKSASHLFSINGDTVVILADNYFSQDIASTVTRWQNQKRYANDRTAMCFLKEVANPSEFGIAEVKDDKIISIQEKPKVPLSNQAILGLYIFDNNLPYVLRTLKPSSRGELEVTDILEWYMRQGSLLFESYNHTWYDLGTKESYEKAFKEINP